MRVRVKICGITRLEQAREAAQLGADAIGLVFAPSPRRVELGQAQAIARGLPAFVCRVGLFVNVSREEILRIAFETPLDAVQLHGDESPEFCQSLSSIPVLKSFSIADPRDLERVKDYPGLSGAVLDSKVPGRAGGTGVSFPWEWVPHLKTATPLILAGGLHPGNVGEAIAQARPYAVDVSSGVEDSPGIKSAEKMALFLAEVARAG